jgi:hypothetical protein
VKSIAHAVAAALALSCAVAQAQSAANGAPADAGQAAEVPKASVKQVLI